MSRITEDRMGEALGYLGDTDESCAVLKTNVERFDYKAEAIKDAVFLREEGSVADRQAKAKTHPEYAAAKEKYFKALEEYEKVRNRRSTENIVFEAWRSLYSGMKKGVL